MKLLHKLLPVATIASVAAVVTPLVSCGCSEKGDYDYKTAGEYESKCAQAESSAPLTPAEALQLFLKDIKKDGTVLKDDLLYNQNSTLEMFEPGPDQENVLNSMKAGAEFLNADTEKSTLSFKFRVEMKGKIFMFNKNGGDDECDVEMYATLTAKNFKYSAEYIGEENEGLDLNGKIKPDYLNEESADEQIAYLKADKNGKLSGTYKSSYKMGDDEQEINGTKSYNGSNFEDDFGDTEETVFTGLVQHLSFESWHLNLVQHAPEL